MNDNVPKTSFQGPLAPRISLGNTQDPSQSTSNIPSQKSSNRSKFFRIGIVLSIALVLPVTIWLVSQQQDVRQRASERPVNAVLKIGNEYITGIDVDLRLKNVLGGTYEEDKYDPEIWQNALDGIQEERIIEQEAKKLGIFLSQNEIDSTSSNNSTSFEEELAYNAILKRKLTNKIATWRLVNIANVNIGTDSAQPNYQRLVTRGNILLKPLRDNVLSGESLTAQLSNEEIEIETNKRIFKGQTPTTSRNVLFSLTAGDVSDIIETENGDLAFFEVIGINDTEYGSFEQWYRIIKPVVSGL